MCQRCPSGCICGQLYVLDGHSGDGEGGRTPPGLLLRLGVPHLYLQLPVLPACGGHAPQPPAFLTRSGRTGLTLLLRARRPHCLLRLCHAAPLSDEEPVGLPGLRLLQLHDQAEGLQHREDVLLRPTLQAKTVKHHDIL